MQKSSLTLLSPYQSGSPILKHNSFEASSRQLLGREASALSLPDCHDAHWLGALHLLPGGHGLQGAGARGGQLAAAQLAVLKERGGFRLHAARGV